MSKPKYRWWSFVKKMIRDYPSLSEAWNDLHSQSITASCSGMPRGGGVSRTVEAIALRHLPTDDQKVYDAVSRAVAITELRPDGKERLALIKYVYWQKKQHTLKEAEIVCHVSEATAKRWHGSFVYLVAECYGFNVDDTTGPT